MAHGIVAGKDNVVFHKEGGWHGLGIVLEEEFTPQEGLTKAGIDWGVKQRELYSFDENGTRILVPSHVGNYRLDTQDLLGVVSKDYCVVQNIDMADFCSALIEEGQEEVKCETVGSVLAGRLVWFLLKGKPFQVAKKDEMYPYIMVSNGHDGRYTFRVTPTTVRVVCQNTAHMVIPQFDTGALGDSAISIKHTVNIMERVEAARLALKHYGKTLEENRKMIDTLVGKTIKDADFQQFFMDCYQEQFGEVSTNPKDEKEERRRLRAMSAYNSFERRFDDELPIAGANYWAALNAWTGVIQHDMKSRGKDDADRVEKRFTSNMFGLNAERTQVAMQRAFRMALSA